MTNSDYQKELSKYRSQKQKLMNNIYLWASLAIKSLKIIGKDDNYINDLSEFNVPSKKKKGKMVRRSPDDIKYILNNAANKELYIILFIYVVAQFESFLMDLLSLILKYDKRKLRINIQGGDNAKKIDYIEVLDCMSYDDIINHIIEKQLCALFYANPKKQLEYIQKVINFDMDEEIWNNWTECKASRDLLVHNAGIINNIYIEKVGNKSRGKIGEEVIIDKKYFEDLLVLTKSLIGTMVNQAKKIII